MRYYGESNVAGAPGNNSAFIAGGIPVGEDPIFPMSQEHFSDYVKYKLDQHKPLRPREVDKKIPGPELPSFLNRGVRGASGLNAPGFQVGNVGALMAQGYPQMQMPPAGFSGIHVT